MKQLLYEADLKGLRPYSTVWGEASKRFSQIKTMFLEEDDYVVFAEVTEDGKKIRWSTELEGTIIPFKKLDASEQADAIYTLQRQVSRLFCKAQKFNNKLDIIKALENALEIPSESYIYWIRNGAKSKCVLTGWGFLENNLCADEHILEKHLTYRVSDLHFTFKYEDDLTIIPANETIYFAWEGQTPKTVTTNEKGVVILLNVPFHTTKKDEKTGRLLDNSVETIIKIHQIWENNEKVNEKTIRTSCFGDYNVAIKRPLLEGNITFKNKKDKESIPNLPIIISIQGKDGFQIFTNSNGEITLPNILPKTTLHLSIQQATLSQTENCTIDFNKTEHLFYVDLPDPITIIDKIATPLTIRVEDEKGNLVPNAEIEVDLKGEKINGKGELITPPIQVGETIEIKGNYRSNTKNKTTTYDHNKLHIHTEKINLYIITPKKKWAWWWLLLPLLLLVSALWAWNSCTKATLPISPILEKAYITIKDSISQKVLQGVELTLDFKNKLGKDTSIQTQTNEGGKIQIPNEAIKQLLKIAIKQQGYNLYNIAYQAKDTVVTIGRNMPPPRPCNEESKSGGEGTTYNTHDLGTKKGIVRIEYSMDSQPDALDVYCGEWTENPPTSKRLGSTNGLVSGKGEISIEPNCGVITVVIRGEQRGTTWTYKVNCPK